MDNQHANQSKHSSSRHIGMGKVVSWNKTSEGLEGTTQNGLFKLTVYASSIIRVQASRNHGFEPNPYTVTMDPEPGTFELKEESDEVLLSTPELKVSVGMENFTISFFDAAGNLLNADDKLGISWLGTEVSCYKQLQQSEKFIGLGEKTGNLDRFGNAYTNWNTDYFGYGIGDDPLYMSIPFYIGIHTKGAYGIFLDNTHKTVFNFGASTKRFTYFSAEDGDMDYYFIHRPSVSGIVSGYTALTGRMSLPPKWSLGFQQCRYSYYPDKEVMTLANTFRDKNMPADVIYLDIHHMEEYKVFTFDGIKFPDAKGMIASLKKMGFKVVVIMDPGIKTQEGYFPYDEGRAKDLFVKYPDGEEYVAQVWPGWCAFPDYTKSETRKWWGEKMAFYTDLGVDGFWTDMNEPASWGQFTPNLIEFDFDGNPATHRKARNVYGMQMARSAMEGSLMQKKNERSFVLTRAGYSGVQRYAAVWTGDNVASEEHMLAGVRLVNSMGLGGVAFAGYDVGGFAGESTKSLFARWMSIAAFAPLYRAHSMINSNDAEPWAFGEEVEEIARNYMKLRYRLLPTIYSAFYNCSLTGLPIASSLAMDYAYDDMIYKTAYQNQYLFCQSFLVAPVESYKDITKVYLPEGNWYSLYSDYWCDGSRSIYVDCPLNYLPVFVKAGSIFTMQSDISSTSEMHDRVLSLHLYFGNQESTFTHYEDDGHSLEYEENKYHKREMRFDPKRLRFSISASEGKYGSEFENLRIYFHGFKTGSLTVNGESVHLATTTYSFLEKLTEFDPLPEHDQPFFNIRELPYLDIPNSDGLIEIAGLAPKTR